MVLQVEPLPEVCIWKAVAYAVSQFSTTWLMVAVPPRSTWSHCGSLKALDQRVPGLPSTAAAAGVPAFSADEAVAGRFNDSSVAAWATRSIAGATETATAAVSTEITAKA